MYRQYIYLADIALDHDYNPLYPPFKSTSCNISDWLDQIIPICRNKITRDIYNFLYNRELSKHNIKSILHLFSKSLIYRNDEHEIMGIVFWTVKGETLNIIYSHAVNEILYNIIIHDMEEYASTISITQLNILWNTSNNFNIINDLADISNTTLYNICITREYSMYEQIFQKKLDTINKYYNINALRYTYVELLKEKINIENATGDIPIRSN